MKKLLILALVYTNNSFCEIRPPSTARLTATAGTGVGSILLEEGAVLNPAPISFFRTSVFSYQQTKNNKSNSFSFIAADTKSTIRGLISYYQGKSSGLASKKLKKRIITTAMAYPVFKNSSLGVSLSFISEESEEGKRDYRFPKIGVTHLLSSIFSLGAIIEDPLNQTPSQEDRILLGGQIFFERYITFLFDLGIHYRAENLNEDALLYRGAIQIQFLSDFFLRGGMSRDLGKFPEKKTGLGVSWIQPKLSFDMAFEDVEKKPIPPFRELSFSGSFRF